GNLTIQNIIYTDGNATRFNNSNSEHYFVGQNNEVLIHVQGNNDLVEMNTDLSIANSVTVTGGVFVDNQPAGASGNVTTYDHLDDLEQAAKYQYQPEDLEDDFRIRQVEPIGQRQDRVLKLYSGAFKQVKGRLDLNTGLIITLFIWNLILTVRLRKK
ncbi:MAG: hypothetical protein CUN57_00385, partial [Phototrophicales bacterium]